MKYDISFKCYYETSNTSHRQELELKDIARWIESYQFTHPNVRAISVKVWFESTYSKGEETA